MDILLNILIFKTVTYNYGKKVLSEEHLKTILYLGNHVGQGFFEISNLNWRKPFFVGQC